MTPEPSAESNLGNIISFQKPPRKMATKYDRLVPVTRDNFTAMLIDSFSTSKNNVTRQLIYFEWLQANVGFNYKVSLNNLLLESKRVEGTNGRRTKFIF